MTLNDLLSSLAPRHALAVVIGTSIVLYVLAANLAETSSRPHSGRIWRFASRIRSRWYTRAATELLRWGYYLGVPYATLLLGYNTVRALGIWNLDWLESLGYAAALALGCIVIFFWVWRPYARTEHPHAVDESRWNWARHILELIYQQAHWALYRSGPILWLANPYLGSFIGLGLAFLEGWGNPRVRSNVRDITRADAPLWTGSLAVASTVIFIFTSNAWYSLAVHLVLDLGLRNIIGFPRIPAPEEDSPLHYEKATDALE